MSERDDETRPEPGTSTPQPGTTPSEPTFAWTPELASGHAPGETSPGAAPAPRRRPLLDAIVWIVGLVVAYGIAAATIALRDGSATVESARTLGRIVGTVAGGLIVAFVLWGIVVFVARRGGRRRRLTSRVVPLLAIGVLLIGLAGAKPAGQTGVAISPSPSPSSISRTHTLDEALAIDAPYRLQTAPASEEKEFTDLFTEGDQNAFKSLIVRRIYSGDELSGYALLADAEVRPGLEAVALASVEHGLTSTDATRSHTTIAGRDVISGIAAGTGYAIWVEAPYIKIVYADSESDAQAIAMSFMAD